mgnify:FL=1
MLIKNIILLVCIILFITSCTINKVVKKHGVRNLEKKQENLVIYQSNKNDIVQILGPASSKSSFDNDMWIFIEREITNQKIMKLGKEKLIKNNVLFLEINNQGILVKKEFYNINEMNDVKFSSLETKSKYSKRAFVYDFLSSMRQKINDPLGKRKKPN